MPCGSRMAATASTTGRSEEHTSELQSRPHLVCRLLLEKKKKKIETVSSQHASSSTVSNITYPKLLRAVVSNMTSCFNYCQGADASVEQCTHTGPLHAV